MMKIYSLYGLISIVMVIGFESKNTDQTQQYLSRGIFHFNRINYDSSAHFMSLYFKQFEDQKWNNNQLTNLKYYIRSLSRSGNLDKAKSTLIDLKSKFNSNEDANFSLNEAYFLDEEGIIFLEENKFESAIELLKTSLQIRKNHLSECDSIIGDSYSYIGEGYYNLGKYEEALNFFQNSKYIKEQVLDSNHRTIPIIYTQLGSCLYQLNDFEQSLVYILKALKIFKNLYGENHTGVMLNLNNLSNIYYALNEWEKSFEALHQALNLAKKYKQKDSESIFSINLAQFYIIEGNWDKAFQLSKEAQFYFERDTVYNAQILSNLYDQLGGILQSMGNYSYAQYYFDKAKIIKLNLYGKFSSPIGQYYYNSGINHYYAGDCKKAIEFFEICRDILIQSNHINSVLYCHATSSMASCLLKSGSIQLAEKYFSESRSCYINIYGKHISYAIDDGTNLAQIYFDSGRRKMAFTLLNELLENATNNQWKSKNDLDLPDISLISRQYAFQTLMYLKGQYLFELGNENADTTYYHSSLAHLELGIQYLDKRHEIIGELYNRKDLIGQTASLYPLAIDICQKMYEITDNSSWFSKMFDYAEDSKAFQLREILKAEKAARFADVPDSLIDLEKKLAQKIQVYYDEVMYGQEDLQKDKQFINWVKEYDQLKLKIKNEYPEYAFLKFKSKTINLASFRRSLEQDVCVTIAIQGRNTYQFMYITRDTVLLSPHENANQIDQCIDQLTMSLTSMNCDEFVEASSYLYNKIIQPLSGVPCKKVIWIPEGTLNQINPEFLISTNQSINSCNFSTLSYAIFDYTFWNAQSATTLIDWHQTQSKKPTESLCGVVPFTEEDWKSNCEANKNQLTRLPWAEQTGIDLKKKYNSHFLLGKQATKKAVINTMSKANVLFFATHAVVDEDNPLQSKIVLSCSDKTNDKESHNLTTLDLYQYRIPAKLAVLTACKTGSGIYEKGEGIISMARGFNYAGCPSVLMTLWSVDDQSSAQITLNFFNFMNDNFSIAESLRLAKIKFLKGASKENWNPINWAGITLIGQDQFIHLKKNYQNTYIFYIGIAVSILIMLGLWYWKSRRFS